MFQLFSRRSTAAIVALVAVIVIMGSDFFWEEYVRWEEPVCARMYEGNERRDYEVIRGLLSPAECEEVITEGLEYAKKHEWTTTRHDDYPTTDNQISETWSSFDTIHAAVRARVLPKLAAMYDTPVADIGLNEMFIAKYEPTKQSHLTEHCDGSEFSFVLALNDNYEGGGTHFLSTNQSVHLHQGDILVFAGQNEHKGLETTKGTRYIVAGFLHYVSRDYCCYSYATLCLDFLGLDYAYLWSIGL